MRSLQGGCSAPVGALCQAVSPQEMVLEACVLSLNGQQVLRAQNREPLDPEASRSEQLARASALGKRVADLLLGQGARRLIDEARQATELPG